MRRTRNGAFNARPLGGACRLYVVRDPPDDPNPAPLTARSLAARLDHAKREAARYHDLPAEAVEQASRAPERERGRIPAPGSVMDVRSH